MTITGSEWLVVLAGIAAIAWVNWYFFLAGRTSDERRDEAPKANAPRRTGAED